MEDRISGGHHGTERPVVGRVTYDVYIEITESQE